MPKKKRKPQIIGQWRIDSMSAWDEDYLNEEVEAFVEFSESGVGAFQFGYMQGEVDWVLTERDGKPAVEFSWEGGDAADGTPNTGRGWAVLEDDKLSGMFFIHMGDASEFSATKSG